MITIPNIATVLILSLSALKTTSCFSPSRTGHASGNRYKLSPSSPPSSLTTLSSTSSSTTSQSKEKREPWDFVRFVRQSSKFVSLPKLTPPSKPSSIQPGDVLWTPSQSQPSFSWGPLDDVVMGGVSSSTFNNKNGSWKGYVTDKNSGGFVGIRTTPFQRALDMSSCSGFELTLSGVNVGRKQFKAVARDSTDFNGICWTATLGGGSKWGSLWNKNNNSNGGGKETQIRVKIPFREMVPTIFAKTVPNQSLKKDNIVGFQLVYSKFLYDGDLNPDFQVGDFELSVTEVKAY